jgi:hypothetical protein
VFFCCFKPFMHIETAEYKGIYRKVGQRRWRKANGRE